MTRSGFTLIELLAVLVFMGLISSIAAISLHQTIRVKAFREAAEQYVSFERKTRLATQSEQRPSQIVLDLEHQQAYRMVDDKQMATPTPFALDGNVGFDAIRTAQGLIRYGRCVLPCSVQGITPSYAIRFQENSTVARWLVVAGLSGELMELEDEKQVEQLLTTVPARRGDDAH